METNVQEQAFFSKKSILIYDDNTEILFLCKSLLARDNYRVETLTRCENVIDDIERLKPDLILMDLWIPEIGGEKAITILKENVPTAPQEITMDDDHIKQMEKEYIDAQNPACVLGNRNNY